MKRWKHFNEQIKDIDDNIARNNAKKPYKVVKRMKSGGGADHSKTTLYQSTNRANMGRQKQRTWRVLFQKTP